MRIGPPGTEGTVQWFFVDPQAPLIPFPHAFGSNQWKEDWRLLTDTGQIGEVPQQPRLWVNGKRSKFWGSNAPCGPVDYWQKGTTAVYVSLPLDSAGVPFACFAGRQMVGAGGDQDGGGGGAFMPGVVGSGTVGKLPQWTGSSVLGDSSIQHSATGYNYAEPIHLAGGGASSPPLSFGSAGLATSPIDGGTEYDGTTLWFTVGSTRLNVLQPSIPAGNITSGHLAPAQGGTGADLSATGGSHNVVFQETVGGNFQVGLLVAGDIPALPASQITSGQLGLARGGSGADLSGTGGAHQVVMQTTAGGALTVAALALGDLPNGVGGNSITKFSVGALAAAGNSQGTAAAVTKDTHTVTSTAANQGVILPASPDGARITLRNVSVTNTVLVYPPTGGTVGGLTANSPVMLAPGGIVHYESVTTGNTEWHTWNATS
jgi:hypothetical protein